MRILVIDDEIDVCKALSKLLNLYDYDVSIATSIPQARKILKREKIDFVLSDINLKSSTRGTDITNYFPNHRKIIFMTGYVSEKMRMESLTREYLIMTKPLNYEQLNNEIKKRMEPEKGCDPVENICLREGEIATLQAESKTYKEDIDEVKAGMREVSKKVEIISLDMVKVNNTLNNGISTALKDITNWMDQQIEKEKQAAENFEGVEIQSTSMFDWKSLSPALRWTILITGTSLVISQLAVIASWGIRFFNFLASLAGG